MKPSYRIIGNAIVCLICGRTSHNLNDVANLYCGACHWFHNDTQGIAIQYRSARRIMMWNLGAAFVNFGFASWDWIAPRHDWSQWFGLFSFVCGGVSATLAWRWGGKYMYRARHFRKFI